MEKMGEGGTGSRISPGRGGPSNRDLLACLAAVAIVSIVLVGATASVAPKTRFSLEPGDFIEYTITREGSASITTATDTILDVSGDLIGYVVNESVDGVAMPPEYLTQTANATVFAVDPSDARTNATMIGVEFLRLPWGLVSATHYRCHAASPDAQDIWVRNGVAVKFTLTVLGSETLVAADSLRLGVSIPVNAGHVTYTCIASASNMEQVH